MKELEMVQPAWAADVERLAAAVAARWGVRLAGVDVLGGGPRTTVRVSVEGEDGVSVELCARISEELSRALDLHDPIPHKYTLEVASPGLDRRLREEADFRRFVGRTVAITTREPVAGRRRWKGRLVGLDAGEVVLSVDGEPARVRLDRIAEARLVVEMTDLREDFARGGRINP
ncbi:MAG TPA: ribosome maturation factor RimP [bacterium]|nr:ribosome maturation factor RimP [bacterium]